MDGASCSHDAANMAATGSAGNGLQENNGNAGTNSEGAEGEEEEDSSSSSSSSSNITVKDLDNFRQQWQKELDHSPHRDGNEIPGHNRNRPVRRDKQVEEQARGLYLQGVEAERKGHLYDAIYFYRRAVQLVPDIEFKVGELIPKLEKGNDEGQISDDDSFDDVSYAYNEENEDDVDIDDMDDLVSRFTRLCSRNGKVCQCMYDQKASHISILPCEIIFCICKWVVSADLDLRSLEQLSMVCRGFYLCARDAELWRLACMRVWGGSCGSPNKYGSWREMYIKRPRMRYNGAYISKTTYIRPGEPAFQDQTYRPWHIVDYYRYVRFFPEGIILMMTTPEEPALSLSKLRYRNAKHHTILYGHFRIHGDTVSALLKRTKGSDAQPVKFYRRSRQIQQQDHGEQTFNLEFQVLNHKQRPNCKLEWRHYSVHTVYRNGQESVSEFDLTHAKFPPFWFSRVRSYTAYSEKPLQ